MNRMIVGVLLLALSPTLALAQDFKGYRTTTLDAVIEEWDGKTKSEGPGYSLSRPEKIKFVATLHEPPAPCGNGSLGAVLGMMGFADMLKQVKVGHCIVVKSASGRKVSAYAQDVLVPGLNSDVKIGRPMEVYADFLAYQVNADRSRNSPMLLVNRFEPK